MQNDKIKQIIKKQSPKKFLDPDKHNRGYICPYCNNGSGSSGDGIVKIPNSDKYKCFVCDRAVDIFDLIEAKFELTNFNDVFAKAQELYSDEIASFNDNISFNSTPTENNKPEYQWDISAYIDRCHTDVNNTSFYRDRGITDEMVEKFNLGYDSTCKTNVGIGNEWKAAIIPTSNNSYEIRNTEIEANDPINSSNKYRKVGPTALFNADVLKTEKDKPICICEGVLDAISIIQCGGQAIALGSAANYKSLLKELDTITPLTILVLALDNDNTGKNTCAKLIEELDNRNISYNNEIERICGKYHDANDRLINDPDGLTRDILDINTYNIKSPQDMARDEYLASSVYQSINDFQNKIHESASRPSLSTGLCAIDDALDGGLYSGLIILGALPSLGKTTLAVQFADNLAKQGRDVLFFSLEQSKYELMSKSISRETYQYCIDNGLGTNNAKTCLGISDGRRYQHYSENEKEIIKEAFSIYRDYAKHLFVIEGVGNISVADIRSKIKDHISYTGNTHPIVIIDYIQILKAGKGQERNSEKQIIDHNVTELKQLSRDFDIPILGISSLNRDNYKTVINMAAFKESGAIEYGSDVLIGLQLQGAGDKDFDVNAAKARNPRDIEFCVIKNRNGKISEQGVEMNYYPMFNYYECCADVGQRKKLTPTQPDRIPSDIQPIYDPNKLIFYDVEVFPNLFVICYKIQGEDKVNHLINPSTEDVRHLLNARLVGFNNRKYDNHILYGWLQGKSNQELYILSQQLIANQKNAYYKEAYNISYTDIYDFATTKQGLKKWEIELGIHHQELGLPWDQPVDEDMWNTVVEYCDNDVNATEAVFNHLQGDYTARLILAELAGMSPNNTTNTLTTAIIFGGNRSPQNHFNYRDLSQKTSDDKPYFEGYNYEKGKSIYKGYEVGEGGFVYSKPGMYNRTVCFDIESMHPSSIIAENLFGDRYTKRFQELLDARLAIKHKDLNKAKQMLNGTLAKYLTDENQADELEHALKIAINAVYGLTCAKYDNPFRDPRNIDNIVAKRGALFMINLKEEVKKRGGEVIHIKTDSIKIVEPTQELSEFIIQYGKEYGYNFDIEHTFKKICLVNNADYIGYLDADDPKKPNQWTATGAKFKDKFVFKKLFTGEDICIDDMIQTKNVQTSIYLDMDEDLPEGEHNLQYIGKCGAFLPVQANKGGGILLRDNGKGGYASVSGTKGYRWVEFEQFNQKYNMADIDMEYYDKVVDKALKDIQKYGDVKTFIK